MQVGDPFCLPVVDFDLSGALPCFAVDCQPEAEATLRDALCAAEDFFAADEDPCAIVTYFCVPVHTHKTKGKIKMPTDLEIMAAAAKALEHIR